MGETDIQQLKARVNADNQVFLQGGRYIAVDADTLEERTEGGFVAKGKRKFAGLLWDSTLEKVYVVYDSNGRFLDYDSLPED